MGQLEDLRAFVRIAELQSIGKAAEQTGVAKSAMSRKLKLLEDRLQTALITRTTRQWSLTEAGIQYYERGIGILQAFDELESQIRHDDAEISGEIKLSVPLYFGKATLSPLLVNFAEQHPKLHLNVDFSDRLVDVVNEHFDLVVRISDLADSTLIARKLCQMRHVCCASPEYLAQHAPITAVQDLQQHKIIQYGALKRPKWTFTSPELSTIEVALSATLNTFDGSFLLEAAERGLGVVRLPDFLAKDSLASGKLVEVLDNHLLDSRDIYLVYPSVRHVPTRTRALIDYLLENVC